MGASRSGLQPHHGKAAQTMFLRRIQVTEGFRSCTQARHRCDDGKPSVTEFSVEHRLSGFTVVRLQPRTGRAHQLRVHLASLGHPIVGDKIYGPDETLYLRFHRTRGDGRAAG